MAKLKTDSPLSRRIVLSFLDFLNSVDPAPDVDLEGLEVAKDCLKEAFMLNSSHVDGRIKSDSLVDIFSSLEASDQQQVKLDRSRGAVSNCAPSSSSKQNAADVDGQTSGSSSLGVSRDELFGQFFAALEKINFFHPTADGQDDPVQLDKATQIYNDALTEMERSGCQMYNRNNLADSLKSQGNKAMQSKLYLDAIELYSCGIALCENNAVYYCNRAAAFTQIHKYNEAIRDCLKSIEIDPRYSKAYSRIGLAYYAQGNYSDAINKGYKKALQLDPNNEFVKENIRVAELKLREELERAENNQNPGSASGNIPDPDNQSAGGSRSRPFDFASMPFDPTALPADIASMFMNTAANASAQHPQERPQDSGNFSRPDEPEVRIGGNISVNFGEQIPEDLSGVLRSVMGMFSGAAPQGNPPDNSTRRSGPN